MSELRDYEQWHRRYDDPTSDLSWRLRTVQSYLRQALDSYTGPIRILSCCSGDGRDVLEVLAQRRDAERVSAVLVEAHPVIADRARRSAAAVAAQVEVRTSDAGITDTYLGAVPAAWCDMTGYRCHCPRAKSCSRFCADPWGKSSNLAADGAPALGVPAGYATAVLGNATTPGARERTADRLAACYRPRSTTGLVLVGTAAVTLERT